MKCGVRFCGGCNPRYDRGAALEEIKKHFKEVDFVHAAEGVSHDLLLVIGGCSNCCADFDQFKTEGGVLKIWDLDHMDRLYDEIEEKK